MKWEQGAIKDRVLVVLMEIHLVFLHKCINNHRIVASFWLISTVRRMSIFMTFCQCSHCYTKEWIFGGPKSTILEVLLLDCVNGICFGVTDSLSFEIFQSWWELPDIQELLGIILLGMFCYHYLMSNFPSCLFF